MDIGESSENKRSSPEQVKGQVDGQKRRKTDNDDEVSTGDEDIDQQKTIFLCNSINRRSVGKAIVKLCGHEGTKNDTNKAHLRRLLQAVISHIDMVDEDTWRNAEVKIYDDNFDLYSLRAGKGDALFLATFDGMNNPQVVRTSRKRIETSVSREKNCTIM